MQRFRVLNSSSRCQELQVTLSPDGKTIVVWFGQRTAVLYSDWLVGRVALAASTVPKFRFPYS